MAFGLATQASFAFGCQNLKWSASDVANQSLPGRQVEVRLDNRLIAALIYGEGQAKVYLHLYGNEGELLTNSGLTREGKPFGLYPHHRGIFIGWNRIRSELGVDDLWHMTGTQIKLQRLEEIRTTAEGATIIATITWHSAKKDEKGSDLLLMEKRKIFVSRPNGKRTQIDIVFTLTAERDLTLDGDCHHAGIHFRAANEVAERRQETSYLWEPQLPIEGGRVVSKELKWARLVFPIGKNWYACTILNAPTNPTEELSWRDYGRFGFFFRRSLRKGETLSVFYRFVVEPLREPERTMEAKERVRKNAQALYEDFVRQFPH
ncbi:MAG: DUF6807 family protein [Armatimonadota bacterium]|nr:PmoA family protein [Armatimonadota bacterium]MDW8143184.1 DUF6807 family protein [Armatimonadota bacterium]